MLSQLLQPPLPRPVANVHSAASKNKRWRRMFSEWWVSYEYNIHSWPTSRGIIKSSKSTCGQVIHECAQSLQIINEWCYKYAIPSRLDQSKRASHALIVLLMSTLVLHGSGDSPWPSSDTSWVQELVHITSTRGAWRGMLGSLGFGGWNAAFTSAWH